MDGDNPVDNGIGKDSAEELGSREGYEECVPCHCRGEKPEHRAEASTGDFVGDEVCDDYAATCVEGDDGKKMGVWLVGRPHFRDVKDQIVCEGSECSEG